MASIIPEDFDYEEIDENLIRFYQICNGEEVSEDDDGEPLDNPFKTNNTEEEGGQKNNGFNRAAILESEKADIDEEDSNESDDFENHSGSVENK